MDDIIAQLEELKKRCYECRGCNLYKNAKNLVFSSGNPHSKIMIIGEAPGEEEDNQGLPFVGRSGQLLRSIIKETRIKDPYICNIIKHRPPNNRNPEEEEILKCAPFMLQQIEIIDPKIIITLGNFSTKYLLKNTPYEKIGIMKLRGKIYKSFINYDIAPTMHPSAVLRNMNLKPLFESDLKNILNNY